MPTIAFTSKECQVFEKVPSGTSWAQVDKGDQHTIAELRGKLKSLAVSTSKIIASRYPLKAYCSHPTPNGRSPRELWSCLYPASVKNKSFAFQIALIISKRGGELCFCLGSETHQSSNDGEVAAMRHDLQIAKKKLQSLPESVMKRIQDLIADDWHLRDSWLKSDIKSDFSSLSSWIDHAASNDGASASISKYYNPIELEKIGGGIEGLFLKITEIFGELLVAVYDGDTPKLEEHPKIQSNPCAAAVLSKPFLILTGPSGTGKTRGAVELAQLACPAGCRELVAVGADWTDNRHVLGYLNPLETEATGTKRPIYETTPILDLILHANATPDEPHVLILDEMNLSHVERYFADFLSAMELEDKSDALKLHAAGIAVTRTGVPIHGKIDFPTNLFVIGTVNIDETTYMFSPKVLDRANVIEIHADQTDIENFLRGTVSAGEKHEAKDYGVPFLEASQAIQAVEDHPRIPLLPDPVRQAAAAHLMALFRIMKHGRGEYGFRTGKEVMAYLRTAHFLAGPEDTGRKTWATGENWHEALDAQILRKILPKLHGSRSRLAPLLGALAQYCATGNESQALEHFPGVDGSQPKRGVKDSCGTPNPVFKNSHEKLCRMIDVLVEEQFVSFIC